LLDNAARTLKHLRRNNEWRLSMLRCEPDLQNRLGLRIPIQFVQHHYSFVSAFPLRATQVI